MFAALWRTGNDCAGAWQFDRYFSRDRKMLGWDRTVGNMHEQMGPFLALFWTNIWLSPHGGLLSYKTVAAIGWLYVLLRSVYPVRDCSATSSVLPAVASVCFSDVLFRGHRVVGSVVTLEVEHVTLVCSSVF